MKIWVQGFNYHPHVLGGSERSARELANGLAARGHAVRVVLSDGTRPYPAKVDDLPVEVIEGLPIGQSPLRRQRAFFQRVLWILRGELDPTLSRRLRTRLLEDQPDIVIMNNPAGHGSAMLQACRQTRTAVLPVFRDYGWVCALGIMSRDGKICDSLCLRCRAFSMRRRALMRRLPAIIAISNYIAGVCGRVLDSKSTCVIPNSLPDRFFDTPRPLATSGERPLTFGYLGRLHPSKGVTELIAGWAAAGLYRNGHRLKLAGEIQGIDLPKSLDAVGLEYSGPQEALSFLDTLDVLIVPSLWAEPFGRSVIEGMARNLWVVGSPYGAIPELIPTGAGEILPNVSADAIAQTLLQVTAMRREILAYKNGPMPQEALTQYRSAEMLDRYEAVITDLCSEQR